MRSGEVRVVGVSKGWRVGEVESVRASIDDAGVRDVAKVRRDR